MGQAKRRRAEIAELKAKGPKPKGKPFAMKPSELMHTVDIVCSPMRDGGWVEMYAGPRGQQYISEIFPGVEIDWKVGDLNWYAKGGMPVGYKSFEINVPGTLKFFEHKGWKHQLATEILDRAGQTIDDCSRDQLGCLLALSVRRLGGTAALRKQNGMHEIFQGGAPFPGVSSGVAAPMVN